MISLEVGGLSSLGLGCVINFFGFEYCGLVLLRRWGDRAISRLGMLSFIFNFLGIFGVVFVFCYFLFRILRFGSNELSEVLSV